MTTYKLYNSEKRELIKKFGFKPHQIKQISFSYTLLHNLIEKYLCEYIISHYCCYGEDICCWKDLETCWMSEKGLERNRVCLSDFRSVVRKIEDKSFSVYKRKMFICEKKNSIWVIIPLRDIIKQDFGFCFDKTKVFK